MKIWNLMKYKKAYLLFSVVVLMPGLYFLLTSGLKLAIDFTGGSVFSYKIPTESVDNQEIISSVSQVFFESNLEVKSIRLVEDILEVKTNTADTNTNDSINLKLAQALPNVEQQSYESIGPSVGRETTINAFKALGWATIGILLYIAFAFRNVPKPYSSFRFGFSAIVAMLHDALLLLGVSAILGKYIDFEVDALFITAVLTVIGFSIHDSIVVFDRIRENLGKLPNSWSFERVVNFSIVETLNRSMATSLTVLITLLSLYVLGGDSIKHFTLALLIGIISGAYSSIFTASPLLVLWEEYLTKNKKKKFKFRFWRKK